MQKTIRILLDTGAAVSLTYESVVDDFSLRKHEDAPPMKLSMADGTTSVTATRAIVPFAHGGVTHTLSCVVVPDVDPMARPMDVLMSHPDLLRIFGDVRFARDGEIVGDQGQLPMCVPCTPKALKPDPEPPPRTETISMVALVELDERGDAAVSIGPPESVHDMRSLAREALLKADVPAERRDWVQRLVNELPGLVRRCLRPAVALQEEIRARTPIARIPLREDAVLPTHTAPPTNPTMRARLSELIVELIKGGLLEPTRSAVSTRAMLIPKVNGSGELRFIADYRDLNRYVLRDSYPLPLIWASLERFGASRYFFKLDLKSFFFRFHSHKRLKSARQS